MVHNAILKIYVVNSNSTQIRKKYFNKNKIIIKIIEIKLLKFFKKFLRIYMCVCVLIYVNMLSILFLNIYIVYYSTI